MSAPCSTDGRLQVDQVGRVQRVGLVVGEACRRARSRAARSSAAASQAGRRARPARCSRPCRCRRRRPPSAAGCRTGRPACAGRRRTSASRSRRSTGAGRLARPGGSRAVEDRLGPVADLGQAGVLADRAGAGAAQLDAVVLGRVVAGGEHRAGQVERCRRRSRAGRSSRGRRRRRRAPRGADAVGEGRGEPRRGGAHVVGDDHRVPGRPRSRRNSANAAPERRGGPLVPLVGHDATDVVRLDDLGQVGQRLAPSRRATGLGRAYPSSQRGTGAPVGARRSRPAQARWAAARNRSSGSYACRTLSSRAALPPSAARRTSGTSPSSPAKLM